MSLKKKLGLSVASAALGLSLIGGGTYAYFNDFAETTSTFAAGTLDLNANPTTIVNVNNIKPGDTMLRTFKLENAGSLDIAEILLATSYNESVEGFGEHIRVNFLWNVDKVDEPIYSTTLADLVNASPDVIEGNIFSRWLGERGGRLAAGTHDTFVVQFEFVDNNQDQNEFQGANLTLNWTFEGKQGAGQAR
ncbi:CalY family protein [Sutcliffiella horikoshii]|uniref:CalY family protein n=1 Tax=Sutcliffiella horikoshii TaxID=79883 RepID=UPI0007D0AA52|nr:CalY family protein [Sutcliffiella horikoshii]MCM3618856.1 CalY family protein [Sutcliffiella horikoshii]